MSFGILLRTQPARSARALNIDLDMRSQSKPNDNPGDLSFASLILTSAKGDATSHHIYHSTDTMVVTI